MSQSKINKQALAIARGGRLRLARQLVNLTRKQISNKYNINPHTLHAWEKGANCISEEKASMLATILKNEGLDISTEWILTGDTSNYLELEQSKIKDAVNLQEDIKIFNEIDYFKKRVPNSIVTLITDNSLSPLFIKGDYVGGIIAPQHEYKKLEGSCCIVILDNHEIVSRKIISISDSDNQVFICSINPLAKLTSPHNETLKFKNIALITRHWLIGNKSEASQ